MRAPSELASRIWTRNCLQVAIAWSVEDGHRILKVTTGSGDRVRLTKEESVIPREALCFALTAKGPEAVELRFGRKGWALVVKTTTEEGRARIIPRSSWEIGGSGCGSGSIFVPFVDWLCAFDMLGEE